jgi:transcriptional accessory protein Tex/SPT6
VRVGEVVRVKVLGVDADSGRISLTMKSGRGRPRREKGTRRPRRDRGRARSDKPRRDAERQEAADAGYVTATADEPATPAPPEDVVPADMSEEEFMKRKLEELRKRFS